MRKWMTAGLCLVLAGPAWAELSPEASIAALISLHTDLAVVGSCQLRPTKYYQDGMVALDLRIKAQVQKVYPMSSDPNAALKAIRENDIRTDQAFEDGLEQFDRYGREACDAVTRDGMLPVLDSIIDDYRRNRR
jgi:hypothetical protein